MVTKLFPLFSISGMVSAHLDNVTLWLKLDLEKLLTTLIYSVVSRRHLCRKDVDTYNITQFPDVTFTDHLMKYHLTYTVGYVSDIRNSCFS